MVFTTDRSAHGPVAVASNHRGGFLERVAFALIVAYIALLAASFARGIWLVDPLGHVIPVDFVNVWAAGRLALDGRAADAFDWSIHKAVEQQGIGHPFDFDQYFGWHYPPPFLFAAAALSLLPYLSAFLTWMALTLPAYAAIIRMIIAHRVGLLLACAFPAVLWNVSVGQNGFLSAALIGGALGTMEKRPLLAGVFLGFLTYKPQLGILFPIVLAVDGRWRVFSSAAITALSLVAASWLVFGSDAWQAFFQHLPLTSELVLGNGLAGFHKLQTIFGVVRWWGGDETVAWALQGAMTVACTIVVLLIWRRCPAYEIKAAALATAALIATPYLYVYDLVALAVPMAFLVRIGLRDGFLPYETGALALATALVLLVPVITAATGLMAVLLVWLLICRRAIAAVRSPAADLRQSLPHFR
jgi:arabinofuranan 3-O-arabinosyltransferase